MHVTGAARYPNGPCSAIGGNAAARRTRRRGHGPGPYYSLTRAEGGTTQQSRYLTAEQAALVREQVEAGQQFGRHLEAYRQACERWTAARLETPEAASLEAETIEGSKRAGCKAAIGTRCKHAGMHWAIARADAIIALRCCGLCGRFEDFWERRSQRRVVA